MIFPSITQAVSGAAGAVLAGSLVWLAWSIDSAAKDAAHAREMASVQADLIRQCDAREKLNEVVIHDLHKNITTTGNVVRSLELRLRKANRVHPAAPSCGVDGAGNVGADERDGDLVGSLPRYAGQCEELKAKIGAWQAWGNGVEKK